MLQVTETAAPDASTVRHHTLMKDYCLSKAVCNATSVRPPPHQLKPV